MTVREKRFYDAIMKTLDVVKVGRTSGCAAFLRDPDGNCVEAVCHHAI